jgi:hypothetical protein
VQVWVYEDTDEQWKEFIPDIQAMLEEDYSFKCERSIWQQHNPYERQHTVNFTTQPMTYMVKCGDTFELSTVVERHVMHGEYVLNRYDMAVQRSVWDYVDNVN